MRFVLASLFFLALHVLCACSLDFDKFGKPEPDSHHELDGGGDDGGGIALRGDPCTIEDSRACGGHDSQQTLVCQNGKWQPGANCDDDERCDSRDGADLGRCVAIPSECQEQQADETFCAGNALRTCNVDRVAFDDVACGAFGSCTENTRGAQCMCADGHAHAKDGSCATTVGDGGTGDAGNGGTGGSGAVIDQPPVVHVVFPLPGVTDRSSITVRGSVSDPEDDVITKLTVNGKTAKVASDGSFSVSAPLTVGKHKLALHVEDDRGAKDDANGPEIERLAYMFERAADIVLDSANKRVIALDGATDAIIAISLEDETREVIVPASKTPVGRISMDLDAANHRVIVVEQDPAALAWIDLETGDRTVISDATHGSGVNLVPHAVALDRNNPSRAFVTAAGNDDGYNSDIVLAVDIPSGIRTKFSIAGVYPVINFGRGNDIVYDDMYSRLIMVSVDGLIAVNLSDGSLSMIATGVNRAVPAGYGAPLFNPIHMTLDGKRGIVFGGEYADGSTCIFEVDTFSGRVHEAAALVHGKDPVPPSRTEVGSPGVYDPESGDAIVLDISGRLLRARLSPGDREFVSNGLYGSGPLFDQPVSIAQDTTRKRWIVADYDLAAIVAVDKASGTRSVISDSDHGSGDAFGNLVAVDVDLTNDEIIVLDNTQLSRVDPVSGARTVIASDTVGTGASLTGSLDLVVDGTRVLVVGCYGASYPCAAQVIAVDLATGNRTVISAQGTGTGALPGTNEAFTGIARSKGQFLLSAPDMLLYMDGSNGNRTVIADGSTGTGPALMDIQALAYDSYEDRALVINEFSTPQKLVAIDLVNGNRTLLSDPSDDGQGPYSGILADLIEDPDVHRLIVAQGWGGTDAGLLGVWLVDRKRTLISEQGRGDWNGMATLFDADTGLLYSGQATVEPSSTAGAILESLDPRTGKRTRISDDRDNGGAVRWTMPFGLALDADAQRMFAINFPLSAPNSLIAIDLDDGTQSVVSDATRGTGVTWVGPFDVAWDTARERVLIANATLPAIVTADLGTGDRVAFSGGPAGDGPVFQLPHSMAIDPTEDRLLIVDRPNSGTPQVVAADLETGDRTLFSGNGTGSGVDFTAPGRIVVDTIANRAVVLDVGNDSVAPKLIEISLADGARNVLADLPQRWYAGIGFPAAALAFDGATEIAYVGALFAFDTVSGDYIQIAGHNK